MEPLHPDLAELAFLIGRWQGEGRGCYPTIEDFAYRETATFLAPPGKAFVAYRQETVRAGDHPAAGSALHTETGYIRPAGPGRVEMVVAQPTGVVEVLHGSISGTAVALATTMVAMTETAKQIDSVERILRVEGDTMTYRLLLGAVGQPHQLHLEAILQRSA
jgi:hypothetical protein